MPFEPGQHVVSTAAGPGLLTGGVVHDAAEPAAASALRPAD